MGYRDGEPVDTSGTRTFIKARPYRRAYTNPVWDYRTSVNALLDYLYHAPYIQHWLTEGEPDPGYGLYGYPSKMYPAVIQGMLMIAKKAETHELFENALRISIIVADKLIDLSQPEGAPLEYLPPTYLGPIYADMVDEYRGKSLADRIMMIYPATAAGAYKKTQLPNGTWHLLIRIEDGEPIGSNYVVPGGIIGLMDRLKEDYGIEGYQECSDRTLAFIEKELVWDFNREGQFEDQKPGERYKNLSKSQACGHAIRLLENKTGQQDKNGGQDKIELAEELIRFAEDQFVIWEKSGSIDSWGIRSDSWLTPCVLEQYNFYTPVNASSGNMIQVYRTAYERTGNILYLAKAIDLANNIVQVQDKETGHYPTYLVDNLLDQEGWINCMVYTARQVQFLDRYLKKKGISNRIPQA